MLRDERPIIIYNLLELRVDIVYLDSYRSDALRIGRVARNLVILLRDVVEISGDDVNKPVYPVTVTLYLRLGGCRPGVLAPTNFPGQLTQLLSYSVTVDANLVQVTSLVFFPGEKEDGDITSYI